MKINFLTGILIGLIVALPLSIFGIPLAYKHIEKVAIILLFTVAIFAVVTGLVFFYRERILNWVDNRFVAPVRLNFSLIEQAFGSNEDQAKEARQSLFTSGSKLAVGWYARQNFIAAIIGLGMVSAGVFGTVVLVRQNQIISQQAKLLCQQNSFLLSSNRFSASINQSDRRFKVIDTVVDYRAKITEARDHAMWCSDLQGKGTDIQNCLLTVSTNLNGYAKTLVYLDQFQDEITPQIENVQERGKAASTELAIIKNEVAANKTVSEKSFNSYRDRLNGLRGAFFEAEQTLINNAEANSQLTNDTNLDCENLAIG